MGLALANTIAEIIKLDRESMTPESRTATAEACQARLDKLQTFVDKIISVFHKDS